MAFGTLLVNGPDGRQQQIPLTTAGLRIGSAADNDLIVGGQGVAPHHALLSCDSRGCQITDQGSSGGTLVDGERLLVHLPQELEPGSQIRIGAWVMAFQAQPAPEPQGAGTTPLATPVAAVQATPSRKTQPLQITALPTAVAAPLPTHPPASAGPDTLLQALLSQSAPQNRQRSAPTRPLRPPVVVQTPQPQTPPPAPPQPSVNTAPTAINTPVVAPLPKPAARPCVLLLSLSQSEVRVAPGEAVALTIAVANRGTLVDKVEFTLEGVPAGGYSFTPAEISLFPDKQGELQLEFRPPRAHTARAGMYPFRVVATSQQGEPAVAEGLLEVLPFYQYSLTLAPQVQTAAFGAPYRLTIANDSNADLPVTLVGTDSESGLSFRFPRPQLVAPAGTDLIVPFRASLRFGRLIGQDKPYPFTITATPSFDAGLAQVATGQLVRHPPLPPPLMRLIATALLALVACAGLAFASAFLCGPVASNIPLRDAVMMRFFPFCRNTASAAAPVLVPTVGGIFSTADAAAGIKATTASIGAVAQQTNVALGSQASQTTSALGAQANQTTAAVQGDASEAQASLFAEQTSAAQAAQQTQTAVANSNSATQTSAAIVAQQTQTSLAGQITQVAVQQQTDTALFAQTQTALAGAAAQTQTALAVAVAQTQTAAAGLVQQTQTAEALQQATLVAQLSAIPLTQTANAVAATQTALARPTSTATWTPTASPTWTATPTATLTPTPSSTPSPTPRVPDTVITFDQIGPLPGLEYRRGNAIFCAYVPITSTSVLIDVPAQSACVLPTTFTDPFPTEPFIRNGPRQFGMQIYPSFTGGQANVLAVQQNATTTSNVRQYDSLIAINFPDSPIYEIAMTVGHMQLTVDGLSNYYANYQLLAYDADRVLIGSATSGNISTQGSHVVSFRSAPDRPIRFVILQDDNSVEEATNTCVEVYACPVNNPLLIERVEIYNAP